MQGERARAYETCNALGENGGGGQVLVVALEQAQVAASLRHSRSPRLHSPANAVQWPSALHSRVPRGQGHPTRKRLQQAAAGLHRDAHTVKLQEHVLATP